VCDGFFCEKHVVKHLDRNGKSFTLCILCERKLLAPPKSAAKTVKQKSEKAAAAAATQQGEPTKKRKQSVT
jgi:hypothetical protein